MIQQAMSLVQVRKAGMKALLDTLGPAGMIRFLQLEETGQGDYSSERHAWLDVRGVEALAREIRASKTSAKSAPES